MSGERIRHKAREFRDREVSQSMQHQRNQFKESKVVPRIWKSGTYGSIGGLRVFANLDSFFHIRGIRESTRVLWYHDRRPSTG